MKSLGILVAMKDELAPIRKRYRLEWTGPGNFFTGRYRHLRIQVELSGAGPQRASVSAAKLARYGEPEMLLSLGFSGGLSPQLGTSDLVMASHSQAPGQPTLSSPALELPGIPRAPMLTLPSVLTSRSEKQEVAAHYSECWAVDMELYSLAACAQFQGLPWHALRAVSDPWNRDLPVDFNRYLNEDGQADIFKLIKGVGWNPTTWAELARFGGDALRARARLMEGLHTFLETITQ